MANTPIIHLLFWKLLPTAKNAKPQTVIRINPKGDITIGSASIRAWLVKNLDNTIVPTIFMNPDK